MNKKKICSLVCAVINVHNAAYVEGAVMGSVDIPGSGHVQYLSSQLFIEALVENQVSMGFVRATSLPTLVARLNHRLR